MFPNLARINRKRSYIEGKILQIKEVRNRVAHHEPVWKYNDSLIGAYTCCHELIQAMSQEALEMLRQIDRFWAVHQVASLNTKQKLLLPEAELV